MRTCMSAERMTANGGTKRTRRRFSLRSVIEGRADPAFIQGYHAAYATICERDDMLPLSSS
jgi:hypothetical protein